MQNISTTLLEYISEMGHFDSQPISTESTFYPPINVLLSAILKKIQIPFEIRVNTSKARAKARGMPDYFANVPEAVWTYQRGGYLVLKKWLGYRQTDRRDGRVLTDDERKWFRQIAQRIVALLALGPQLDALYQLAASDTFTAAELGIER